MPQEPQENVDLEAILQTGINTNEKLDEVAVNTEGQLSQQMETNKKLEEVTDAVDVQTEILHKGMSGMTPSMEAMGKAMTFAAALMEKLEGPTGPKGERGEKGDKGDQGPKGDDAKMVGPKGDAGKDGKDGADGKDGKDGKPGPMGPAGLQGEPGKDGKDGKDGKEVSVEKILKKLEKEAQRFLDEEVSAINTRVSARTYAVGELENMESAATGQVPMKQSNGTWAPQTVSGTGDMAAAVYDPTNVADDAFDMENMAEGATKKILTSAERVKLSNLSGTNTGDQTTIVGITGTMAQFDTAVSDGNVVYQSQALGTPASGTLTNCSGLPATGLVADTTTAIGVGSINLGHASDTTITRSGPGAIQVEGVQVVLNATSPTLGTITTTGNIELGNASDTTIARVSAGVISVEGVTVPTISSTNTLTNKRVTRRVTSTSGPGATPTINTDNCDAVHLTALATAITSMTTNLSGTPAEGDMLRIDFTDDGTARAITWGSSFEASTVALPTTTVISTRLDVGFVWNSVTSKWRCIASA